MTSWAWTMRSPCVRHARLTAHSSGLSVIAEERIRPLAGAPGRRGRIDARDAPRLLPQPSQATCPRRRSILAMISGVISSQRSHIQVSEPG
jgi:hypothetical protein